MTDERIAFRIRVPEVVVTGRVIEVSCGDSVVALHQVMGANDRDWTVYEVHRYGYQGLVGKVDHAPITRTSEELIPWAADLVTRRQRALLSEAAVRRMIDSKPRPVQDDDNQQAPDQG